MPRKTRGKSAAEKSSTSVSGETGVQGARALVPVVAIGASAGGLEAFKEMLGALPLDTGMAFVLVVHLPAKHDTVLPEILSRISSMPICEAKNGVALEGNRVYVLPGGSDVGIEDGRLTLTARRAASGQHRPVDHFLESLADSKHQAIAVILSGSASDGTLGVQQIKAAGGITFAQDDTAEYTSMPRSAIATGAVDFVLRPQDIAREIGRIATHPYVSSVPETAGGPSLEPVLAILHENAGVDFRQYKPNTLYRRITRRMLLHRLGSLSDYVQFLKTNAGEAEALYHDILINVTSFFRNPEAFEEIKREVFPALTQNRSRHDPVRIWTLGCSTGEEAYSLAMAFAEFSESAGLAVPLQVFATDLNAASIDKARSGIYAKGAVQEISDERLRRFFVEMDGSYRIAKPIRDVCIFARHNVLSDPPFTRIDLVTCRNMLIYLSAELQEGVIPVLHYALRPDGYLWLGSCETIGSYRDLFELKHAKHKIYAKIPVAGQLPVRELGEARLGGAAPPPMRLNELASAVDGQKEIDRLLVARYSPPSVLIRGDLEILQYRGNTAPYLAPAPGKASLNLLKMLREGLILSVRSAVQRAKKDEMPAREEAVRISDGSGGERCVDIEVIPVKSGVQRADLFLVLFEEVQSKPPREPARAAAPAEDVAVQEIGRLKQELAATREYLQSVIEQQEAANEELQSANEEVQSANEELQSINEELETSKEEVQSSNEELATVNDELNARNIELAQSNNDLVNLLASVQLAIVMLGPNMRIRRFTPMAEKLLNLIPTDVGRPMSDIKLNIDVPDMDALLAAAIDTMAVQEREVKDAEGRWHLLRVRPYRTMENKIEGAVIVLIDVDSLKRSQEQLRQQTELLNQAHEPIVMWELDGYINYWNKAAEETYGFTREQAIGRRIYELLITAPPYETFRDALREDRYWTGELVHTRRDGQRIIVESRMVVVIDPEGRSLVVEANRPITERKEAESILRRIADDLVTADRNKDEFLAMLAHELRNPLAPLRNVVSVLQAPSVGQAERSRALDIMDRQIHNMARLIDDLLDVSRITLSQIELRRERVDLGGLVCRVIENNQSSLDAKNQTVHVGVPDERVYVEGDAVRLEQLLGNLVHNAWKYTDSGGHIDVSLEIEEAQRGKAVREAVIRIRDNGMGIERDRLSDVFDLFMRATRSIDQRYGGLGIGLTLVRRIAELHGGRVEARSEGPGKGAEFVVRLPALSTAPSADQPVTAEMSRRLPRPHRVLIVDDNVDNTDSLAMSLRAAGHHVETANSGAQALKMVNAVKPDVMLIDIGMPDMDGYTLARELKGAATDGLKLVAVSGYGHAEARTRASAAGFDDYLVKPASAGDIDSAFVRLFSET